jgi:hypothetical protein
MRMLSRPVTRISVEHDPWPAGSCQLVAALYETYARGIFIALPPVSVRFVFVYIRVYRRILCPVLFVRETIYANDDWVRNRDSPTVL